MSRRQKTAAFKRWQVLMTTTLIQSIVCGIIECFGGMMIPIMKMFEKAGESNFIVKASFVGSLASGSLLGFSPLSGYLVNKLGVVNVGVMGGILVFLATFMASFASTFIPLLLTYGLQMGMGASFLFIANNIIISLKFPDDNIAAFAMLGFGNGVMNSIMPHIMVYTVKEIGLHGVIRALGLMLTPIMFLPFFWDVNEEDLNKSQDDSDRLSKMLGPKFQKQLFVLDSGLKRIKFEPVDLISNQDNYSVSGRSFEAHNSSNYRLPVHKRRMKKPLPVFRNMELMHEIWAPDMGSIFINKSNINNENNDSFRSSHSSNSSDEYRVESESSKSFDFLDETDSEEEKVKMIDFTQYINLFQMKGFLHFCISMFVAYLGYQVPNIHIANFSQAINLQGNAQMLLTCLGAASAIGPLINPFFIDRFEGNISNFRIFQMFVLGYGITVIFLPLIRNYNILMVACGVIGYCDGSFSTLIGPIVIDFVGNEMATLALGIFYGFAAPALIASGPLAGYIYQTMKGYDISFFIAGIFFLIGGFLLSFTQPNAEENPNQFGKSDD